jgi:hypothetical protein
MLTCKVQISKITFNREGYLDQMRTAIKRQLRLGVAAWLRAVLERVPTYSGMARSSLKPIGDYVNVEVTIGQQIRVDHTRNPELGEAMGMKPSQAFQGNQYVYTFNYTVLIPHFAFNDENASGAVNQQIQTPWHSMEAGKEAFQKFINDNLMKNLKSINSFIVTGEVIYE